MATHGRTMRRGLPRRSGGEPWPPAHAMPAELHDGVSRESAADPAAVTGNGAGVDTTTADSVSTAPSSRPSPDETPSAASTTEGTTTAPPAEITASAAQTVTRAVRRGLPRIPGGEPWPPADHMPAARQSASTGDALLHAESARAPVAEPAQRPDVPVAAASGTEPKPLSDSASPGPAATVGAGSTRLLRRGLPRVPGGEAWPAETAVVVEPVAASAGSAPAAVADASAAPTGSAAPVASAPTEPARAEPAPIEPVPVEPVPVEPAPAPTQAQPTPKPPVSDDRTKAAKPRPARSRTTKLLLGAGGLLVVALAAVFFTRWLVTLGFMQDFLATYPGETPLPVGTEPGFPAWVQWQHFFNFFLIVLIIRSGLQVRRETRPPGYWTPKWSKGGDGKISINLWFHQALDVLWLLNGLIFVVLLFATGHWVRLVPTTWEVFPNALSAVIQYLSLDWPTENGWMNYNSLQMLAYFIIIFIAAPLAAISGVRMSGIWPKDAKTLNRLYPVEWARAIHFPVMLFFVAFIIAHVALVFATGALRNLNHMYGGQDAVNWVGFWIFFVSLLLVVGAWIAARPVVLAPIAGLSGRVSSR